MISINLENHVSERRVISAALEIDTVNHSTQYAHVYYNGRAFATISARRVLATGKRWTVTDTNGATLFEANFAIEFANDAFRRRLISIIHDMERPDSEPTKSEIGARVADENGIPVIDLPASEVSAADLSGMPELIEMADRAANPARAALTRAVNASIAAGNPVFVNMPAIEAAKPVFDLSGLSAMQIGRLNAALDKQMRFADGIRTIRAQIERMAAAGPLVKSEGDGMIDWSRTKFNRMGSDREQREYEARLKAKRYFYLNNWQVPKVVFDAVTAA